jgi:rare lipoprotein A
MIAMNGTTPGGGVRGIPFPTQGSGSQQALAFGEVPLPDYGPVVPIRPDSGIPSDSPFALASLSYADERVASTAQAFAAVDRGSLTSQAVADSWKRSNAGQAGADYVAAGTFDSAAEAGRLAKRLSGLGKISIRQSSDSGREWYAVELYGNGRADLDTLLQSAWSNGAPDALVVRN